MIIKRWLMFAVAGGLLTSARAPADEAKTVPPEHPAHQELRALRDRMLDAFNKNDLDALLQNVHPNVVVTWQNGEVSRGHQGIRDYYQKMMHGPKHIVDSVTAKKVEVDERTLLYGDKGGVAFGTIDEDFKLANGMEFHLPNRWTAGVVKDNDRWLVVALHISANVFDNPIQDIVVRRTALWSGGIALLVGLALGAGMLALLRRRRRAS
jgi:ketosteroid isomerase-like protein